MTDPAGSIEEAGTAKSAAEPAPAADTDLIGLFGKALRQLGQAGHPVAASRLAAKAWWLLHDTDARAAERVNGVMHYLARLPEETDTDEPIAKSSR